MENSYVIEFLNENEFRKRERALKKCNMLAYKKLIFDYYPNFREGKFAGTLVSKCDSNDIYEYYSYELALPTDIMFKKRFGIIVLHYRVYYNQKIVLLTTITPEDILTIGDQLYKGVLLSRKHIKKDMFKIDLLNMLNKQNNKRERVRYYEK